MAWCHARGKREQHVEQIRKTGLKDFARLEGNLGAYVLTREVGRNVDFLVISLWDSTDSIKTFASEDMEKPRYYKGDHRHLLELEPEVKHYEVAAQI